jgi:hypothetical protein
MSELNTNSESLTQIEAKNEGIQANIEQLRSIKDGLIHDLNNGIANNSLNQSQVTDYANKMAAIDNIILGLNQNQIDMYSFFQKNIASTAKSLEEQEYATTIVSSELRNNTIKLGDIEQEHANKLRLIQINDYYSEQYLDRTNIMKSVILVCIILIILTVLKNKGLINKNLFNWLIIILIVIGGIYLFKLFLKATSHNNMQYQQYDWNFNINAAPQVDTTYPNGDPADKIKTTTCSTK